MSLRELERIDDLTLANEGAMAEQVAGQLLRLTFPAHQEPALYYWFRDERGAQAEVDYVAQHGSSALPVGVKAGATGGLKSLHSLMARRKFGLALRFNAALPSLTPVGVRTTTGEPVSYKLLSLPLFLVEEIPRLLDELEALEDGPVPGRGRRGGRRGP